MADSVALLAAVNPVDLVIKQHIIPWENRNRDGRKLNPGLNWYRTQHSTGNTRDGATAEMHAVPFLDESQGGDDGVSFHLVVDHIEAYQTLPLDEVGYHASDGLNDYWQDVGGWGSIAMELCVNYDYTDRPDLWLKAKQNAVALWAAVLLGDPRLNYGSSGGPHRFSLDRHAPHNRWAYDRKWCPDQLMDEGNMLPWSGDGPFELAVAATVARIQGASPPMDPTTDYPEGMDRGIAEMLFGNIVYEGKRYSFNPDGSISRRWLRRGMGTGEFPELVKVRRFDDRLYFIFAGGWTLFRIGNGPVQEMK